MRLWLALTAALEVATRLALFGSVWVLLSGTGEALDAAQVAVFAAMCGGARAWAKAELLARGVRELYLALSSAIASRSVDELHKKRDELRAGDLAVAAYDVAAVQAQSLPDLIGALVALGLMSIAMFVRLGPLIPGLGLAGALLLVVVLSPARMLGRRARQRGWEAHVQAAKLLDVQQRAAVELRGAGLEERLVGAVSGRAAALALAERSGQRLNAAMAAVPALLSIALVSLPAAWLADFTGSRLGEIGVFAAAGVSLTFAAIGALDTLVRNAPLRRQLEAFLGLPRRWLVLSAPARAPEVATSTGEPTTSISAAGLCFRYPGVEHDTPSALTFAVAPGEGVALSGANGAGKSTTMLLLLGLLPPTAGELLVDGAPANEERWRAVRSHAFILPQQPWVVPDESIGWHLGMFGTTEVSFDRASQALSRLGVLPELERRAKKRKVPLLDLPMGELSGGERQRVLLARAQLSDKVLLFFDEPELGLDADGRVSLRELLAELAKTRLVVVAAHDPHVIPKGFRHVVLATSAAANAAEVVGNEPPDRTA